MGNGATGADKAANNQYQDEQASTLSAYDADIGNYLSNVNSTLAQGNPYQSKSYLTNQNLETSGAMHSEEDAAKNQLQQTAARTGTNTAALANEEMETGRQGQRDLTGYNAARDTTNEQVWQGEKQGLMQDELAGTNSEAGIYGTETGGRNNALSNYTNAQDAEDAMWGQMVAGAAGGAGAGLGAAFAG